MTTYWPLYALIVIEGNNETFLKRNREERKKYASHLNSSNHSHRIERAQHIEQRTSKLTSLNMFVNVHCSFFFILEGDLKYFNQENGFRIWSWSYVIEYETHSTSDCTFQFGIHCCWNTSAGNWCLCCSRSKITTTSTITQSWCAISIFTKFFLYRSVCYCHYCYWRSFVSHWISG